MDQNAEIFSNDPNEKDTAVAIPTNPGQKKHALGKGLNRGLGQYESEKAATVDGADGGHLRGENRGGVGIFIVLWKVKVGAAQWPTVSN